MHRSSWRGAPPPSSNSHHAAPQSKASSSTMDSITSPSSTAHQFPSPPSAAASDNHHFFKNNNNAVHVNGANGANGNTFRKRHSTMTPSPSTLYSSNDPFGWPEEEVEDAVYTAGAAGAQEVVGSHDQEETEDELRRRRMSSANPNPPPPAPAASPSATGSGSVTSNAMNFWKQKDVGGGGGGVTVPVPVPAPSNPNWNSSSTPASTSTTNNRHLYHPPGGEESTKSQTSQSNASSSFNPYSYTTSSVNTGTTSGGMNKPSTTATTTTATTTTTRPTRSGSEPAPPSWVKNALHNKRNTAAGGGAIQQNMEESTNSSTIDAPPIKDMSMGRIRSSPQRWMNKGAPPIPRTISSEPSPPPATSSSNHYYQQHSNSSSSTSPRSTSHHTMNTVPANQNQNKSTTTTVFQKLSTMMQGPQIIPSSSSSSNREFQQPQQGHQGPAGPSLARLDTTASNQNVGEMQIKLDIAAAQLLTNEMKTKDIQQQLQSEQVAWGDAMDFLQKEMQVLKDKMERQDEELTQERTHSSQLQLQLDDTKRRVTMQMKEVNQSSSNATAEDLAKQVELGLQQDEEMKELYMEIDRLHESNKAERSLLLNQKAIVEDEKRLVEKQFEECRGELKASQNDVKTLRQEKSGNDFATVESQAEKDAKYEHQRIELKNTRKELLNINLDFRELAEEIERLEKELEAVSEDRDELLRRSVLYHKQSAKKGRQHDSSLEESEIEKLRSALEEENEKCLQKDVQIEELENMVSKSKYFDLDLSAIDVADSASFATEGVSRDEQLLKVLRDRDFLRTEIGETKKECDKLKICLADAMKELEEVNGNEKSLKQLQLQKDVVENRVKELNCIIKEQDEEIIQLKDMAKNISSAADISTDALREELNNVVEWLNSSNRIEGDPSIECRIKDPPEMITGNPISADDDPIVQALYRHVKTMQMKLLSTQAELNLMKYDSEEGIENVLLREDTPDSMEALASKEADLTVKSIRRELETTRKEVGKRQETNGELRQSLKDAIALIKPMKDHINRTDQEKEQLRAELASTIEQLKKLDEKTEEFRQSQNSFQSFDQMPTPQKSNRTSEKDQTDESQGMESELKRLKSELDKKIISEGSLIAEIKMIKNREGEEDFNILPATSQTNIEMLTNEVAVAKADLKGSKKVAKKLRKSLEEAVGMMNAFREHVETAEKERKKLKRKVKHEQQKNLDTSNMSQMDGTCDADGDPDRMENTSTILHLKSHIIEMEHEIRILEDRIAELEDMKTEGGGGNDRASNDTNEVRRLKEKLQESERGYEITKKMLNDVSNVNKELLHDLKQTEVECGESLEECDILKQKLRGALEEIDNAKYVATSSLRKIEEVLSQNGDVNMTSRSSGSRRITLSASGDKKPLTELIGNLETHIKSLLTTSFTRSRGGRDTYTAKSVRVRDG